MGDAKLLLIVDPTLPRTVLTMCSYGLGLGGNESATR
jgi:hypothetical protein